MVSALLLIGAGGFLGAILRYQVSVIFSKWTIYAVPTGTYIINVLGSFALGLIYGANTFSEAQWQFFSIGFLGAFTTFSTFNFEMLQLKNEDRVIQFFIYGAAMYLSNLGAAVLGYWWGR